MIVNFFVPRLGSLLGKIPDDWRPLAAVGVGSLMLVAVVVFHGAGLHSIMVIQDKWRNRLTGHHAHPTSAALVFGWIVFLMLALQIVEIVFWAIYLNRLGLLKNAHDAIYFCANAYTTLGMGKMELDRSWRLISPIIGMSGLFTFAWTTSALVDVVAAQRKLVTELQARKRPKRETSSQKAKADAVVKEEETIHQ